MLKKNQYEAINLLVYTDMRDAEIKEKLNISDSTLWRWKKNDEFIAELEQENRRKFKRLQTKAIKTMEVLVDQGHFQAAKYILDGNSYAPTEKHELDMSATITVDYGEDDAG